jgi:hypothetical protein
MKNIIHSQSCVVPSDLKLLNYLRLKKFSIVLYLLLIAGCSVREPEKSDPKAVNQIIIDYFKAISDKEYDKLYTLSTPDFLLFENGLIWNNDSLIKAVKKKYLLYPNGKMSYRFGNFITKVDCNSARTHYLNIGERTLPDTTLIYNWIENATFVKEHGEWKLEFLHSTRLK